MTTHFTMEKRIELEKRGRNPEQIKDLNLDNCRSTSIVGLDDSYVNLEVLSMINIGLTSLKGFPKLPSLKRLELSDNRISNGLNYLHGSLKLEYLNLCGNKIKDFETLEPLKELKNLQILDLFNCDVTEIENYRDHVFSLVPNLNYLDGYDRTNKEIEEDEDLDEDVDYDESDAENGVLDEDDDDSDDDGVDGEDDDDDDDDELDEEDEEDFDDSVGLGVLAQDKIDEEEENDDFVPGEEDDEDDDALLDEEDDVEDDDAPSAKQGEKRKVPEEEEASAD